MPQPTMVIVADYTQETWYTLAELSALTGLSEAELLEWIAHDIIRAEREQQFNMAQLKRLRMAQRLQRDLEVNLAGVGLVLSLMDELTELRSQLAMLDKHLLK